MYHQWFSHGWSWSVGERLLPIAWLLNRTWKGLGLDWWAFTCNIGLAKKGGSGNEMETLFFTALLRGKKALHQKSTTLLRRADSHYLFSGVGVVATNWTYARSCLLPSSLPGPPGALFNLKCRRTHIFFHVRKTLKISAVYHILRKLHAFGSICLLLQTSHCNLVLHAW